MVDVMLIGKTVCSSNYHYVHKAYIEILLTFSTDTKKGELTAAFWYEDTPNHSDMMALQTSVLQHASSFLWIVVSFH